MQYIPTQGAGYMLPPYTDILLLYTGAMMTDLAVGTALYAEWISTQLPIQSQHSFDPSHPPEKMCNMPYIAFA